MNTIKQINVGSSVFFKDMDGYKPKDNDVICIVDKFPFKGIAMHTMIGDDDIFIYKDTTKEEYIKDLFDSNYALKVGKFLVPSFAEHIGLTIEDLPRFKGIIKQLDDKHKYEKIIYESYIENKSFTLNEEQLNKAYEEYKKYR